MADIYIDFDRLVSGTGASADSPYSAAVGVPILAAWNADMGGDTCYITGSLYRGRISTGSSASNYRIKGYGDDKPIIKASTTPAWTQEGDLWYCTATVEASVFFDGEYLLTGQYVSTKPEVVSGTAWFDSVNSRIYIADNPNSATLVEVATVENAVKLYVPKEVRDIHVFHGWDTAFQVFNLVDDCLITGIDAIYGGSPATAGAGKNCIEVKGAAGTPATNVRVKYCTAKGGQNNSFEIWTLNGAVFSDITTYGSFSNEFELWKEISNSTFERNRTFAENSSYRTRSTHFARLFGYGGVELTVGQNDGNTFRNNLAVGDIDSGAGIVIDGRNDNNLIYHNNIINYGTNVNDSSGAPGLTLSYAGGAGEEPAGTEFKNNLVVSNRVATPRFYSGTGVLNVTQFDGNCWYNSNGGRWYPDLTSTYVNNITLWNALSYVGTDVNADPELTSNYEIESGSAAEGIGVAGLCETDINGYYRYGDQDAGCYQIREMAQTTTRVEAES